MRRCFCWLVLLLALPTTVRAQARRLVSADDPTVNADSIYRLATDATALPEQDAAFLLDDGVLRLEADGRGTRRYRQIIQILKPSAVARKSPSPTTPSRSAASSALSPCLVFSVINFSAFQFMIRG